MKKIILKELGFFVLSLISLSIPIPIMIVLDGIELLNWVGSSEGIWVVFSVVLFLCVGFPFKEYKIFFRDISILSIFIFGIFVFLTM